MLALLERYLELIEVSLGQLENFYAGFHLAVVLLAFGQLLLQLVDSSRFLAVGLPSGRSFLEGEIAFSHGLDRLLGDAFARHVQVLLCFSDLPFELIQLLRLLARGLLLSRGVEAGSACSRRGLILPLQWSLLVLLHQLLVLETRLLLITLRSLSD